MSGLIENLNQVKYYKASYENNGKVLAENKTDLVMQPHVFIKDINSSGI